MTFMHLVIGLLKKLLYPCFKFCNMHHSKSKSCSMWKVIQIIIFIHILIFYVMLLYLSGYIVSTVKVFQSFRRLDVDNLFANSKMLRSLLAMGKGGGFNSIQKETLDRLFVMSQGIKNKNLTNGQEMQLSFIGLDVSHSGEPLYIYRRIAQKEIFPFELLVVDIGANDGFMSSNSLNFIQLGWNAILVEPVKKQLDFAKENTKRYRSHTEKLPPHIEYVEAVISDTDGTVELTLTDDLVSMENFITNFKKIKGNLSTVTVPSMTVKTFCNKYDVPNNFAVLSIDAEGVGHVILHQWIDLGYRPAYVIYEAMHNKEHILTTESYMKAHGYTHLAKLGWNHIFELSY